jgi:hypothetical protein
MVTELQAEIMEDNVLPTNLLNSYLRAHDTLINRPIPGQYAV